jgi:hypothetical protein
MRLLPQRVNLSTPSLPVKPVRFVATSETRSDGAMHALLRNGTLNRRAQASGVEFARGDIVDVCYRSGNRCDCQRVVVVARTHVGVRGVVEILRSCVW